MYFEICMRRGPSLRLPLKMFVLRLVKLESLMDMIPLRSRVMRRLGTRE